MRTTTGPAVPAAPAIVVPAHRRTRPGDRPEPLRDSAIFTVLWVGFAVGLATGGDLLIDAWAWLTGLEPVAAVDAWILVLPIAVGLWA